MNVNSAYIALYRHKSHKADLKPIDSGDPFSADCIAHNEGARVKRGKLEAEGHLSICIYLSAGAVI